MDFAGSAHQIRAEIRKLLRLTYSKCVYVKKAPALLIKKNPLSKKVRKVIITSKS